MAVRGTNNGCCFCAALPQPCIAMKLCFCITERCPECSKMLRSQLWRPFAPIILPPSMLPPPQPAAAHGAPLMPAPPSSQCPMLCPCCAPVAAPVPAVQVDVIDARFVQLREAIGVARDFMEADAAHRAYVDSLVTQTFLDLRQLMQIVEAIFAACTRLCSLVKVRAAGGRQRGGALARRLALG